MREQTPYEPGRPPLLKTASVLTSVVVIVWAAAVIAGVSQALTTLLLTCGGLFVVAACLQRYRSWKLRVELPAHLRKNLRDILRVELPARSITTAGASFGTLLHPGPPARIRVKRAGLPPIDGDVAKRMLHIVGELAGESYVIDHKKSKPGRHVTLRKRPPEAKLNPRQRAERNLEQSAGELFPKHTPRVECVWDDENQEEDYLLEVVLSGVAGMDLALSGKRRQVLTKLRTRLPRGNWVSDVDPSRDLIHFRRSKPLPAVVVPPQLPAPLITSHQAYRSFSAPLGVGDNAAQAVWVPTRDAHLLIIGGTGGGKTITEHGVIQQLAQAGWRIWLVDGKRIEFIGYRDWPNVEFLAQRTDHQIRVLRLAHETMMARYDLIERGQVKVEDLDPIAVVIDELTSLLAAVKSRYQETKAKGMPAKDPVLEWIADIVRLGRSAKIHVVVGLQRPDAAIMGGEMRDNFGARISLGKLQSKEASMMMWDDPAIGVAVPAIKGRAIAVIDGAPGMVQATFTANPDPSHDDYHRGMVEAMRPTDGIYSRKAVTELGEDATWHEIISAPLQGHDGQEISMDPVSSDESRALRQRDGEAVTEDCHQLQSADDFTEALALFSYDPVRSLKHGRSLAVHLTALAKKLQPAESMDPSPAQDEAGQTLTNISLDNLSAGSQVELRDLEPGWNVVIDEIGSEEITVSECTPDEEDPHIYYLTGYTADGEQISAQLPADTTVEALDIEADYAWQE